MASKLKSECTPTEWAAHLEYIREWRLKNIEAQRERRREYSNRPEVKARRKAYDDLPTTKERKAKWHKDSGQDEKAKSRDACPKRKERKIANQRCRRTGFTEELWQRLFLSQQGCCAICGSAFPSPSHIRSDHCHASDTPRGLLCHPCNIIEGYMSRMEISPEEFAKRLSNYLANPPARNH